MIPDIDGRTITARTLLTQKAIAACLKRRGAHFLFIVKGNHKNLNRASGPASPRTCPGSPTLS